MRQLIFLVFIMAITGLFIKGTMSSMDEKKRIIEDCAEQGGQWDMQRSSCIEMPSSEKEQQQ